MLTICETENIRVNRNNEVNLLKWRGLKLSTNRYSVRAEPAPIRNIIAYKFKKYFGRDRKSKATIHVTELFIRETEPYEI